MPPEESVPPQSVQWNAVTWYSKFLALVLFVALVCGAFYFGRWYEKEVREAPNRKVVKELTQPAPAVPKMPVDPTRERRMELQEEIHRLIRVEASDISACNTIGYGHKACGGPAQYLVYSSETTDVRKLTELVNEFNLLVRDADRDDGQMSTCDLEMPGPVVLESGTCVQKPR